MNCAHLGHCPDQLQNQLERNTRKNKNFKNKSFVAKVAIGKHDQAGNAAKASRATEAQAKAAAQAAERTDISQVTKLLLLVVQ